MIPGAIRMQGFGIAVPESLLRLVDEYQRCYAGYTYCLFVMPSENEFPLGQLLFNKFHPTIQAMEDPEERSEYFLEFLATLQTTVSDKVYCLILQPKVQ